MAVIHRVDVGILYRVNDDRSTSTLDLPRPRPRHARAGAGILYTAEGANPTLTYWKSENLNLSCGNPLSEFFTGQQIEA
jgi:hypothetical protein